jgi:hypothetical protein
MSLDITKALEAAKGFFERSVFWRIKNGTDKARENVILMLYLRLTSTGIEKRMAEIVLARTATCVSTGAFSNGVDQLGIRYRHERALGYGQQLVYRLGSHFL